MAKDYVLLPCNGIFIHLIVKDVEQADHTGLLPVNDVSQKIVMP
jgi:hypothetical protein